jgi:hypothetical protein
VTEATETVVTNSMAVIETAVTNSMAREKGEIERTIAATINLTR